MRRGIIDITGCRFGKLVALRPAEGPPGASGGSWWLCRCDCGNTVVARSGELRSGGRKSCGCAPRGRRKTDGAAAAPKPKRRCGMIRYKPAVEKGTVTKSFSLRRETWEYLKRFADDNGITYSAAADVLVGRAMEVAGAYAE